MAYLIHFHFQITLSYRSSKGTHYFEYFNALLFGSWLRILKSCSWNQNEIAIIWNLQEISKYLIPKRLLGWFNWVGLGWKPSLEVKGP